MNFKFFKKISLLEKFIFFLILLLIIVIINKLDLVKKENFEDRKEFIKLYGDDIYDDFYVSIYDNLVYDQLKNNFEVGKIINKKVPNIKTSILDIGCTTGNFINSINDKKITCLGIDKSKSMINRAKKKFPQCNFKIENALNNMAFQENEFTHITCLNFTIYCINNKSLFFENCYKWLVPNGYLIIHLVDVKNFNKLLPSADPLHILSSQFDNNEELNESIVTFKDFEYKSKFNIDYNNIQNKQEKSNANLLEKIKFNDDKIRINQHEYFMNTQKEIIGLAKKNGFILREYNELNSINYDNNYIYWLYKPE